MHNNQKVKNFVKGTSPRRRVQKRQARHAKHPRLTRYETKQEMSKGSWNQLSSQKSPNTPMIMGSQFDISSSQQASRLPIISSLFHRLSRMLQHCRWQTHC